MNALDVMNYGRQTMLKTLEDYIVYTFYSHKREHAAQIALYKKRLKGTHG
jgi:hypothetical protein